MARRVRIGALTCLDNTPSTIFPSNTAKFLYKPREQQVLDLPHYSVECKHKEFTDKDKELTMVLRSRGRELSRAFPAFKRLCKSGMLALEDQAAFPLPLDHDPRLPDWLTMHTPVYQEFMMKLATEVMKRFPSDEVMQDAAGKLITDYSYQVPFASCIHHDGQYSVGSDILPGHVLLEFRKVFDDFLWDEFINADIDACKCPLNHTKATGFNTLWPDGKEYTKAQSFFAPEEFITELPNNLYRYDNEAFKLAWYESGRLLQNLDLFLSYCTTDELSASAFLDLFMHEALSVHVEAYRSNQPDSVIWKTVGQYDGVTTKDRFYSYEDPLQPLNFISGKVDNKKWSGEYHRLNPECKGPGLRKRPIFPAPNASFSPPFISLFRMFLHRIEQSATSFPTNRPVFLQRYDRFVAVHQQCFRKCVTYDRSNSEQFITDNWDKYILTALPGWVSPVINTLGYSVVPSTCGPRAIAGGLCSGTAQTTFLNWFTGLITTSIVITKVRYGVHWESRYDATCRKFLECIFKEYDEVELDGWYFLVQSGTDDQSFMVASPRDEQTVVMRNIEYAVSDFDAQKLSVDVCDKFTAFGLDMSIDSVSVASSLGLTKVFLMEHTTNGDAAAFKILCRLRLLPEIQPIVEQLFTDFGFGSLSSYEIGEQRFWENIVKFGYPVSGILNEHSFSDRIVMAAELEKRGIDPRTSSKFYPREFTQEVYNTFRKFFEKRR